MSLKKKILMFLIILAILDMIIPIPFTALLLIYVISKEQEWFSRLVADIYSSHEKFNDNQIS